MTTTQSTKTTQADSSGKGLTQADKAKAADKAKSNVGRTKPWVDLVADAERIKEGPAPREKTVLHAMNTLLKERGAQGASTAEIKAAFKAINLEHHDPATLMRWANKERGYGYHQKKDGNFVIRLKAE